MTTWFLVVTIWFQGAMNSYQLEFNTEDLCKSAAISIGKSWAKGYQMRQNLIETHIEGKAPELAPPLFAATCVKDVYDVDFN